MRRNKSTSFYAIFAVCLLAAVAAMRFANPSKVVEQDASVFAVDDSIDFEPFQIEAAFPPVKESLPSQASTEPARSGQIEKEVVPTQAPEPATAISAQSLSTSAADRLAKAAEQLAAIQEFKPQTVESSNGGGFQVGSGGSLANRIGQTSFTPNKADGGSSKIPVELGFQPVTTAFAESEFPLPKQINYQSEYATPAFSSDESELLPPFNDPIIEPVEVGDRFAAAPFAQDKPKFKKFGAAKSKPDESDSKEDEEFKPKQPVILSASNRWKLAGEPKLGDRYKDDTPLLDGCSDYIPGIHGNFSPTPTMPELPYDPNAEMNVYQGKTLNANQRPLLELGRPWYQLGPISEGSSILGFHNHVNPQYLLFGDFRSGIASNRQNGNTDTFFAQQLNLFHHLKLTSTERIVAGMTPLNGAQNSRYDFERDEYFFEGDADFDFAFIEADLGAIAGGFMGETLPFDLPFAVGIMPLVFQNGVWFEDAILGAAVTIPARNSPRFDISNMDITFFAGYDKIDSPAFQGDDSAARVMGIATFIEAMNGYFEIDYAFLDDRSDLDRSYHNFAAAYTRRIGRFLSHSSRIIVNGGQSSAAQDNTADGVLLISENSLITAHPSTVVPYLNMWAGFDRPQSVARAGIAGGILRNTGILFESDNLTGYPTLDATANDTFGMAMGLNLLADEFAQQLIVEMAMLGVMGEDANRNAAGDQYGVGARYQLPLTNSVIFRADAMVGFLRGDDDVNGVRMELRKKW